MNALMKEPPQSELAALHTDWLRKKAAHQQKVAAENRGRQLRGPYADRLEAITIKKQAAEGALTSAHKMWISDGAEGEAPTLNWSADDQRSLVDAKAAVDNNDKAIEELSKESSELDAQAKTAELRFRDCAEAILEEQILSELEAILEKIAPIAARVRYRDDFYDSRVNRESPSRKAARRIAKEFQGPRDRDSDGGETFKAALDQWIREGCDGAIV